MPAEKIRKGAECALLYVRVQPATTAHHAQHFACWIQFRFTGCSRARDGAKDEGLSQQVQTPHVA